MKLPERFSSRMNGYFEAHPGSDAASFFEAFECPAQFGIRLNRNKVSAGSDASILLSMGCDIDPVPWCSSGYYASDKVSGNDPYSHAGVFYQQEPSAMLPAEILAPKPGERILDLCAAPGGKSTRIAELLCGEGLLIANDISSDRCRALLRNIERMGIDDVVILNESPEKLSERFEGFFDKILVDAPCSGEGMFRRDPSAIKSWERYGTETVVKMQRDILKAADRMLRSGGAIVYSTCTFSEEENERMAEWFMLEFPGYETVPHPEVQGVSFSRVGGGNFGAIRIWPHESRGEGHFCVNLRKGTDIKAYTGCENEDGDNGRFKVPASAEEFFRGLLVRKSAELFLRKLKNDGYLRNGHLHFHKMPTERYAGLRTVKTGAYCGDMKSTSNGTVFEPSASLPLFFRKEDIRPERFFSMKRHDDRILRYLKGETIFSSAEEGDKLEERGYVIISVDDFPLGFAKNSNCSMKNIYPKSWRIL